MNNIEKKDIVSAAAKGFSIGAAMTVPGISGGTLALIVNIYDRLVDALSSIAKLKDLKKNILFLVIFVLSAGIGMFSLSSLILFLLGKFPFPVTFFFVGAIVGGIPVIFRKTKVKQWNARNVILFILCFILGVGFVLSLSLIPFSFEDSGTVTLASVPFFVFAAFMIAIALILPGISFSHMLIVLGIYEAFYGALHSFDFLFLGILGVFTVIWLLVQIRLLDTAMKKQPFITFSVILGFVVGSIKDVVVSLDYSSLSVISVVVSVITLVAGCLLTYFVSRKEKI